MYASYAAISLGAKIIEKHYVDSHDRKGPDVSCSMDKTQIKELIKAAKLISKSIPGEKNLSKKSWLQLILLLHRSYPKKF